MKIKRLLAMIFLPLAILIGLSLPLTAVVNGDNLELSKGGVLSAGTLAEETDQTVTSATAYSNSSLATYTNESPNSNPRTQTIDIISIHCMAGQMTAQGCADYLAKSSTQASSNYCVGKNGDIAVSVSENRRSWCTSSNTNDQRAITIEVASDSYAPYNVTAAAYNSLINLLVDICQRNPALNSGLRWKNDASYCANGANGIQPSVQNMTVHMWYANKACPGAYLLGKHAEIAATVNARLEELNIGPSKYIAEIAERSILGWNSIRTDWVNEGAKMVIKGGSWANQARINYTGASRWMFNISSGQTIDFKFKLNMLDVGAYTGNADTEGNNTAFFLVVRDFDNADKDLFRIKFWIGKNNKTDNRVEAIANTDSGDGTWWDTLGYNETNYKTEQKWVTGIPSASSEYHFAFNTTDLLMSKYNGNDEMLPIVDRVGTTNELGCGAWFYDQIAQKLNGVTTVCFDVQGDNGFTKDVDMVVTEINGQSLANDGSKFTTGGIRTTLGTTVQSITVGNNYEVPFAAKHLWNDDGGVEYTIKWSGAASQAEKAGKIFTPTVAGNYSVTMTAKHDYFGASSKTFNITATSPAVDPPVVDPPVVDPPVNPDPPVVDPEPTIPSVEMVITGASIRIVDSSLRFEAKIKKADYDALNGYTVEVGMIAVPTSMVGDNLTVDTANAIKIVMVNSVVKGDYILFNGVITDFPTAAYDMSITARTYVKVVDGGKTNMQYGNNYSACFSEVAASELANATAVQTSVNVNQVVINGQNKWSAYTQAQINKLEDYVG